MGFFYKLKCAMVRFMYGRNGADQLSMSLMWGSIIVLLVSSILFRRTSVMGNLLHSLAMAVWLIALFRMFSKNLGKRREENSRWVNWIWKMKSQRQGAKQRKQDKEHKYFVCKNCKTICRVPVGKGKVVITCPKCGAEIHGKT